LLHDYRARAVLAVHSRPDDAIFWRSDLVAGQLRATTTSTVDLQVIEEQPPDWEAYGTVPIAFNVDRMVNAVARAGGGYVLRDHPVPSPYQKNYDTIAGERPRRWSTRFDTSRWGVLVARANDVRAGGAVIAVDTPTVHMLEGRADLAVLWDLRVAPEWRGKGVGTALFRASESWAQRHGKAELKVETQNVNAGACRFYERMGCELRAIDRLAYPSLPHEVQLLWYKRL
jgi:GNAT superfamily N-acetyltransferase